MTASHKQKNTGLTFSKYIVPPQGYVGLGSAALSVFCSRLSLFYVLTGLSLQIPSVQSILGSIYQLQQLLTQGGATKK